MSCADIRSISDRFALGAGERSVRVHTAMRMRAADSAALVCVVWTSTCANYRMDASANRAIPGCSSVDAELYQAKHPQALCTATRMLTQASVCSCEQCSNSHWRPCVASSV